MSTAAAAKKPAANKPIPVPNGDFYQLVELSIELLLEVDPLRSVLLDEIDIGERMLQIGRELEVRLRRAGRQAQSLESWPCGLDELSQRSFRIGRDVRRDDLQSSGQKQRAPTRPDHAGANDSDGANGPGVAHFDSLLFKLRRRQFRSDCPERIGSCAGSRRRGRPNRRNRQGR